MTEHKINVVMNYLPKELAKLVVYLSEEMDTAVKKEIQLDQLRAFNWDRRTRDGRLCFPNLSSSHWDWNTFIEHFQIETLSEPPIYHDVVTHVLVQHIWAATHFENIWEYGYINKKEWAIFDVFLAVNIEGVDDREIVIPKQCEVRMYSDHRVELYLWDAFKVHLHKIIPLDSISLFEEITELIDVPTTDM